jgi:hypothetical protein
MRENPVFNAKTSFLNILITAGIAISSLLLPAAFGFPRDGPDYSSCVRGGTQRGEVVLYDWIF